MFLVEEIVLSFALRKNQQQQSLFVLTVILALSKKKVTKLNEIVKNKIGVLAAWKPKGF